MTSKVEWRGKKKGLVNKAKRNYSIWTTEQREKTLRKKLRASGTCGTVRKYLTFLSSEMQKEGRKTDGTKKIFKEIISEIFLRIMQKLFFSFIWQIPDLTKLSRFHLFLLKLTSACLSRHIFMVFFFIDKTHWFKMSCIYEIHANKKSINLLLVNNIFT